MRFAAITLFAFVASIQLEKKEGPEGPQPTEEGQVWREEQPDLYTDKDSVNEAENAQAFHDLMESNAFEKEHVWTFMEFYHPDEANSIKYRDLYESIADLGK